MRIELLISLFASLILCSCATLILQPTTSITIGSEVDSLKICLNNDSSNWQDIPTVIYPERSKKDLILITKSDSVEKNLIIKSQLTSTFWFLNILTYGVGYIIDLTNQKRFTYPSEIIIDPTKEKGYFTRKDVEKDVKWARIIPEKNLLTLKISLPECNHLYLNKDNGYGSSFGFLGISFGVEYYFSNRYCLNTDIGVLTDFPLPFPAPIEYPDSYSRSFANYADIQIGTDFRKLHIDCGIQFTQTSYYERETVELFHPYIFTFKYYKRQYNAGLAFSSYFRLTPGFNLGFNYYPSFINWDGINRDFHYNHLLFVELMFKFNLYRPKKINDS